MAYEGASTLSSMNTQFKYIQDKAQSLLPDNSVIMRLCPEITEATKEGRKYLVPVQLSHENGVTYGDGTVFALNDASAAVYEEIEVDAQPIVLLTQISESVANRMANSKQTFITEATLRARTMLDSLTRYLEISMLYGKSTTGWGEISTITYAGGAATTATVVITAQNWSAGIWASSIGAKLDAYELTTKTGSSTFKVTGVTASTRTVAISGSAADLALLETAVGGSNTTYFMPTGAYANDMIGLERQITGGASYFGIDPTVYTLWQGQSYDVNGALTMAKTLAGSALAVSVGGLNVDSVLMVSAKTYQNLNTDQAALRKYDESYDSSEADNGFGGLTYYGPGIKIKVIVNNIVKEGEAYLVPPKYLSRVGAKELSFQRPGKTDEFFQEIPGYAGYSLRCGAEFAILLSRPAMAVRFYNITNT